jgi:hypothetical protein
MISARFVSYPGQATTVMKQTNASLTRFPASRYGGLAAFAEATAPEETAAPCEVKSSRARCRAFPNVLRSDGLESAARANLSGTSSRSRRFFEIFA